MKLPKIHLTKEMLIISYKLLHDALFLFLISCFLMLLAEGALPGIISDHISLAKISIATLLVFLIIIWLGKNMQIHYNFPSLRKSKLVPMFTFLAFLLIGNSLLKFALWENITITLTSLLIFFLIYKSIFSEK